MKNKIYLLFAMLLSLSTAVATGVRGTPYDLPYDVGYGASSEPSKEDLLQYLHTKRTRAEERLLLIDEEIRCVQRAQPESGAVWSCYEAAQQKRQRLKQKYQALNPYPKRQRQRGAVMPNFESMGLGRMPMPW